MAYCYLWLHCSTKLSIDHTHAEIDCPVRLGRVLGQGGSMYTLLTVACTALPLEVAKPGAPQFIYQFQDSLWPMPRLSIPRFPRNCLSTGKSHEGMGTRNGCTERLTPILDKSSASPANLSSTIRLHLHPRSASTPEKESVSIVR